jgi:hypothetical protein
MGKKGAPHGSKVFRIFHFEFRNQKKIKKKADFSLQKSEKPALKRCFSTKQLCFFAANQTTEERTRTAADKSRKNRRNHAVATAVGHRTHQRWRNCTKNSWQNIAANRTRDEVTHCAEAVGFEHIAEPAAACSEKCLQQILRNHA